MNPKDGILNGMGLLKDDIMIGQAIFHLGFGVIIETDKFNIYKALLKKKVFKLLLR